MDISIHDVIGQFGFPLLGRISDLLDVSPDTWFKIAAVVILWVYMILTPGRETEEF
jgi:hypothetical protein